jgi:Chitobiase/beta-hexosaminidase C-terminal domain/Glycosyl hydrolase family 79 C-terminal beta domain
MQKRCFVPSCILSFKHLAIVTLSLLSFDCNMASLLANAQTKVYPATPYLLPSPGTYPYALNVTIGNATAGSTIYYTTNGAAPTTASLRYTAPISVPLSPATVTIRAFAVLNGVYSSVTGSTYTIAPQLPMPVISPAQGSYMSAQNVTITPATAGQVIHYTTDGTAPTVNSPIYSGTPIMVTGRTIVAAMVAGGNGYSSSAITSKTYTILPATPYILPSSGTYTSGRTVTIGDATAGTTIYYTADGTIPTTASARYTGAFSTPSTPATVIVSAFAVSNGISGYTTSATYKIAPLPVVPYPVITPSSGTYSKSQTVTISDSLSSAKIFYTLDGSTPTASSPLYTGPFSFGSTQTGTTVVQAVAYANGYQTSTVSQSNITLSLPAGVIATTIVNSTPVIVVASNFLGFSHEWISAQTMMGTTSLGVNNIYRNLITNLTTTMGGPLLIRIGGGSTDTSGVATAATVEPFIELAQASNVKFILGVNLGSDNLSLAEEQAKTFESDIPSSALAAIEIGNEPDGYSSNGLRSPTYSYADFLAQYQEWTQGISLLSSNTSIAGPTFGTGNWILSAQPTVSSLGLKANIITQHKYLACADPSSPLASDLLLQPSSSTASLWLFQPYAAAAHEVHSSFRMDEMNSICGGGQIGLSNTFSSALWSIDTMFEYVNAGVDGVNWNSGYVGGAYDLFQFSTWNNGSRNIYALTTVRPLYYGLLLFAEAAGNNAQLLPSSTLASANIKVWVTTDSTGRAHLVIINKDQTASGSVQLTLPGYRSGSIVRLTAGSYLASTGVTIAGQTYDGSPDGTLQGTSVTETTYPSSDVWTIPVNSVSAVLVNLQP